MLCVRVCLCLSMLLDNYSINIYSYFYLFSGCVCGAVCVVVERGACVAAGRGVRAVVRRDACAGEMYGESVRVGMSGGVSVILVHDSGCASCPQLIMCIFVYAFQ